MSVGILILSFLTGLVGVAAGGILVVWRMKDQQHRLLDAMEKRLNGSLSDSMAGQLLDLVDKRLGEFSRLSRADCLMTSPTQRLSSILGRWHQYNVTIKNRSSTWIHVEYEIKATATGALEFSVEYSDNQGGTAEYLYEGVMRDDRVVLIGRPANGEQPCFVEIWPHLANKALRNHFGICFNQSWDQQEAVIPCIMSRTRIDPSDDEALDSLWLAQLKSPTGLDVFPRLRSRLGDL